MGNNIECLINMVLNRDLPRLGHASSGRTIDLPIPSTTITCTNNTNNNNSNDVITYTWCTTTTSSGDEN